MQKPLSSALSDRIYILFSNALHSHTNQLIKNTPLCNHLQLNVGVCVCVKLILTISQKNFNHSSLVDLITSQLYLKLKSSYNCARGKRCFQMLLLFNKTEKSRNTKKRNEAFRK